ncbi:hypothetical protein GCM10022224_003540 [Nonomuraea antimicrobica]|uniref:Uncharacterized protein n=1 Tax=Nonomuraea antimicrobica TaxID=561173 RepID=A0ABP7AZT5_9ACTN
MIVDQGFDGESSLPRRPVEADPTTTNTVTAAAGALHSRTSEAVTSTVKGRVTMRSPVAYWA